MRRASTLSANSPVGASRAVTGPIRVEFAPERRMPRAVVVAIGVLGAIDVVLFVWGLAVIA